MISPHHNKPPAGKDDPAISSGRKAAALSRPPQDPPPKCPRCDSPNTKFCYYNNYSLAQPRHFCKTCRRYWTNGGALRNVPIGGGCRKTKKIKTSSGEPSALKFFQGVSPAMDFQLNFPRISPPAAAALFNPFSALDNLSNACGAISSMDNPSPSFGFGFQEMGQSSNLASSIESLSSINQDLHWKLQRQRLNMLQFSGDDNNNINNQNLENDYNTPSFETLVQTQKPQPILFQNLDMSQSQNQDQDLSCADIGGACDNNNNNNSNSLSTAWFFDNPYATVNQTPATSGTNLNGDSSNWNIGVQDLY